MNRRTYLIVMAGATGIAGCTESSEPRRGRVTCGEQTVTPQTTPDKEPVTGSWPTVYFDGQNTSYAPDTTPPSTCPQTQWNTYFDETINPAPAVVDGVVYTVSGRSLRTFNATTGNLRAEFEGDYLSAPTVANGTAFVGGAVAVSAIDLQSGDVKWKISTDKANSWPAPTYAADTDIVYTGTSDGEALAISTSGEIRWRKQVSTSGETTDGVTSSPAVGSETVFYSTADDGGAVYALDRATGKTRWAQPIANGVWDAPALSSTYVFVPGGEDLVALSRETGDIVWRLLDNPGTVRGSPALADGTLYVQAGPGLDAMSLFAIDAATGTVEWETPISLPEASVSVVGEQVLFGAGSDLVSLHRETGELLWTMDPGADIHSPPVVVDGTIFFAATEAGLFALG